MAASRLCHRRGIPQYSLTWIPLPPSDSCAGLRGPEVDFQPEYEPHTISQEWLVHGITSILLLAPYWGWQVGADYRNRLSWSRPPFTLL
jgi:hypothetical protein